MHLYEIPAVLKIGKTVSAAGSPVEFLIERLKP
jgi:hypothetical protein